MSRTYTPLHTAAVYTQISRAISAFAALAILQLLKKKWTHVVFMIYATTGSGEQAAGGGKPRPEPSLKTVHEAIRYYVDN